MLVCLSSGFTNRYKHDVLRSISLPKGNHLRFRYELSLISESVKTSISSNNLAGMDVCISYLDRSDHTKVPIIVPCRQAKLIKASILGNFCVLDFEVGDFWTAKNVENFNRDIRAKNGNVPYWNESELKGEFVFETEPPSSLAISSDIGEWQKLVDVLKTHIDFVREPFFYFVNCITQLGKDNSISPSNGIYKISADNSYEVKIVQYSPGPILDKEKVNWLLTSSDPQAVSFITNKLLAIDSNYDEKILRFRTKDTTWKNDSMINIYRHVDSDKKLDIQEAIWDFDLKFEIKADKCTPIIHGLLIGLFVAAQGVLPIVLSNSHLAIGLMLIAGIAAGMLASFRLRKV